MMRTWRSALRRLQRTHRVAAVDREHAAGHESPRLRGQQQQRAVEMLGLADAALRDTLDQPLPRRSLPELAVHLGLDVAGTDRVDANVVPRPFHGEGPGEM